MKNTIVKKLKNELRVAHQELADQEASGIRLRAKLERYESEEEDRKTSFIGEYNRLEDQVA